MDPLGDLLTTRPIQTGWEFTMEPYPSGRFGLDLDPDPKLLPGPGANTRQSIMRNWDLNQWSVQFNLPFPILWVRGPIQCIITPIWSLPNRIRQVVTLISHICSYPPHHSHLQPLCLSFWCTTLPSSQNTKLSHPSLSLHAMIMSWQQVQHTLSPAYNKYSIHRVDHPPKMVSLRFILMITRWSLNVASASGIPPYTIDCNQLARYESSQVKSPCHITTVVKWLTDKYSLSTRHTVHRPPLSTHPISLHPGLQAYRQTGLLMAFKFAWSWPPSAYLLTCSLTASNCISKLAWTLPQSVSPNTTDYGLQVHMVVASQCISKLVRLQPPSSHSHRLHVVISKFARSRPPGASPISPDHILLVYLSVQSIVIFRLTLEFFSSTACSQSWYTVCWWVAI